MSYLGLKLGSTGPEARSLRLHLTIHHGARLPATDLLDGLAITALRRFQRAQGLDITGVVDAATEAALRREERAYTTAAWRAGAVLPSALQRFGEPCER